MKRSLINNLIEDALDFFAYHQFHLPPFAFWTPADWREKELEVGEIVHNELGWDVTDYGLDDFHCYGLLLFTLRNGSLVDWQAGRGKPYCEKVMIAEVDQEHQMHFHWNKVEDIINRAGGKLAIQLYNASPEDGLADTPVTVSIDGVWRTQPAGGILRLSPGESITLTARTYHKFWAEGERVMLGEVSTINDDKSDNCFYQRLGSGRFSAIQEDEASRHLLFSDYAAYWGGANPAGMQESLT